MSYEIDGANDLWNKRANWVAAMKVSKNKYERISLGLKIAYYDLAFAKQYHYAEGTNKAQARIADLKRKLRNMQDNDEIKPVRTLEKNLKKQIEYDKKLGNSFNLERRNGKEYLYKQKRIRGTSKKSHEYLAKNLEDLNVKHNLSVQEEVFGENWALKELSPFRD